MGKVKSYKGMLSVDRVAGRDEPTTVLAENVRAYLPGHGFQL